ncbi:MAG: LamG-like jellyroll fold domain-containing protein, partial [Bacteroidota bacterium]
GNGHWYAMATKDGELRLALDDDATKTQLGVSIDETTFPPMEWNHIAGVIDTEQDSIYLYLNGVQIGSLLNETDMDMSTTGLPLVIGNYHSGVRKINGALDEIEIYDRALSADDVAEIFAANTPTNSCTVVETITQVSDDATLSDLSVDVGTLSPAFDPAVPNYSLEVPAGTAQVTISATTNDPNATLTGDGVFSTLPGTAVVSVTAEDGITMRNYNISISVEGAGNSRIIVEPGFSTLVDALNAANAGDTLVLKNGEAYSPIESYQINKHIVIIAEEIPSLPGLANMPIIDNIFGVSPVFQMNFGGDLELIGVDVNGGGAANIINCQGELGVPSVSSIYINRCRLHNTTDDILNDARDGNVDMTQLESCIVRNSFIYDSGFGHGLYVKNYHGESTFIFENLTFWNLGQQFNWIRHFPTGIKQPFVYNHLTGYNLSTALGENKEIFGNSDAESEAALEIDLKNSILHTQVSTNEGSLKFNNTTGRNDITINNNVLFQLQPIVDGGGTINKFDNQEGVDPQFQDPDNGDFTVLNEALWTAADDGEIVGATYWLPGFVDDFSDLMTSTESIEVQQINLKAYPNPVSEITNFSFHLEQATNVNLKIYDMMGREVQTVLDAKLVAGDHILEVSTDQLQSGIYVYQFVSNGLIIANKIIKQ